MCLIALCILGNFACFFLLSTDFFKKMHKHYFRNKVKVSNTLYPDQVTKFNLGPNCLQRSSGGETGMYRVNCLVYVYVGHVQGFIINNFPSDTYMPDICIVLCAYYYSYSLGFTTEF